MLNSPILAENSNDKFYKLFREEIDNYSDLDLARLSLEQKQSVENILLQGCMEQDKESMTTLAFMLLTGTIIKTDINRGLNILYMVLDVSPIEIYLLKENNNPKGDSCQNQAPFITITAN